MSKPKRTIGDSESGVKPILGLALLAAMIYAVVRIMIGAI